ncbi:MAG: sigma-54-dependent Fis family transcriptional regulator [Deltaproteobacteria bacterium]|nr:sigma-54-dependent Fis family transcriptional regulator [Deltaproteobacteria bacterium]
MKSILVISGKKDVFRTIKGTFSEEDYRIANVAEIDAALKILTKNRYDLLFVDLGLLRDRAQGMGYREAFEPFWNLYPTIEIIVLSPQTMLHEAVKAVKAGASDFLTYPVSPEEAKYVADGIRESIMLESERDYLRDQFWEKDSLELVQTKSPLMKEVFEKVRSVAPTRSTVLLIGETGTGKSLLAKLIHQHSNRRDAQFISVHCGAIPESLLESELFGHEKGAFTGAIRRKLGKFEIAHGGTIFLDEIGTLSPTAQIKLLQVLQDGTFQRVGGEETIKVDVRVISATNVDLKKMCDSGQFRKDLFYRLNVFPIEIPPLRERVEDIPHLVEVFLKKLNRFNKKQIHGVHPHVMNALKNYPWTGNIRELENLIERAYILERSSMLCPESFPVEIFQTRHSIHGIPIDTSMTLREVRHRSMDYVERKYLKELLTEKKGKIKDTAQAAGITTRQMHKLMAKHGLRKEDFRA